jgi:starch phosphorylase
MESSTSGDYVGAFGATNVAETIAQVCIERQPPGRQKLRLRQQYFLAAASVGDMVRRHLTAYGTLDDFARRNAVQINDTIGAGRREMMRVLSSTAVRLEQRSNVSQTFSYTNHTVCRGALGMGWGLIAELRPRILSDRFENNRRFCEESARAFRQSKEAVGRMAPVRTDRWLGRISRRGVSRGQRSLRNPFALSTTDVFPDFYRVRRKKFKNVTYGIASRRWLGRPIGTNRSFIRNDRRGFPTGLGQLSRFAKICAGWVRAGRLLSVKRENKARLRGKCKNRRRRALDTDMIFDVQVKRLPRYMRQQSTPVHHRRFQYLRDNRERRSRRARIFSAQRLRRGYFIAKQITSFCASSPKSRRGSTDPGTAARAFWRLQRDAFEILMPAAEFSSRFRWRGRSFRDGI